MRRSVSVFGGVERFKYPEYVWSPAGGWWNNSRPDWKKNTILAFCGAGTLVACVFFVSASNERRYRLPDRPILSQRFGSYTLVDDPDYYEKLRKYKAEKKSFWSRVLPESGHHH